MLVRLATEKDIKMWDEFVLQSPNASFMQSWDWGEVQRKFGAAVWRLVAEEEDRVRGVALVLKREVSLGRCWLYIPRGPIFNGEAQVWRAIHERIKGIAGEQQAIYARCDPVMEEEEGKDTLLVQFGWQKSEREVQPRNTLVVDLRKKEDELIREMRQKTRYNVRLAGRKGVTIKFSSHERDGEHFLQLARQVRHRNGFRFHPSSYYRAMREILCPAGELEIAVAEHGGSVLAVHQLIKFGDTVTYVHGASSSSKREFMAPHLLQWESMKRAKREGYHKYDLFGVAPEGAGTSHPWAGVTRFKLGFGGQRVDYIGAYDLVLDPAFYTIYNVARRVKGALR